MMFLALISTACISNVIYSLQAMLIYARIINAMDGEAIILFKFFSMFFSFCGNAVLSCVSNTKYNQNVSREGLLYFYSQHIQGDLQFVCNNKFQQSFKLIFSYI